MKKIQINRRTLSRVIWEQIGHHFPPPALHRQLDACQDLRSNADYDTGSISDSDAEDLYGIVRYFSPFMVAEVGTFIGRSTMTMAHAMEAGNVYTCDASNDITLPTALGCETVIEQFTRSTSTEMFKRLVERSAKVDLFYLDGRIPVDDLPLINSLMHDQSVFVLDDFEGIEKGVANAAMLMGQLGPYYVLVYPRGNGKTAMMLPRTLLEFTNQ